MRGMLFRGGYHDFTIETGGLAIYPRLVAAEHHKAFIGELTSTGSSGLDALLGGGIERGTSLLLIGGAGVGKSSIALTYAMAAAARGEAVVVFAFDEGLGTAFARAAGLGMPLQTHVDSGRVRVQQIDPAEMSPGEFAHRVRESVQREGVKVVVIDSLNGYMNAMPDERFLTAQLHEMLSYLGQSDVATLVVSAHQGLIGTQMNSPVDATYLADTVILLRYFEAAGEVRQAISVIKKRGGEHERTIRELRLADGKIRVGEPLRAFRGVLTGVPIYEGKGGSLLEEKRP
jgi:circadian clock protein KaiC